MIVISNNKKTTYSEKVEIKIREKRRRLGKPRAGHLGRCESPPSWCSGGSMDDEEVVKRMGSQRRRRRPPAAESDGGPPIERISAGIADEPMTNPSDLFYTQCAGSRSKTDQVGNDRHSSNEAIEANRTTTASYLSNIKIRENLNQIASSSTREAEDDLDRCRTRAMTMERIPLRLRKKVKIKQYNQQTSGKNEHRGNCNYNIISIVKIFIICHILQLLPSLLVANVPHHHHHSATKWTASMSNSILFAMATRPPDLVVEQLPASAAPNWMPAGSPSPSKNDNKGSSSRDTKQEYARSNSDRLLDGDLVFLSADQSDKSLGSELDGKRPLDLIKRHHRRHHNHNHHPHHTQARNHETYQHHQKVSPPPPEKSARERTRRHHNEGYYTTNGADRPIVATRKGLVRGVTQKLFTGKFVDAFLGIPYAQPPIGNFRFRHPQPMNPWQGELDASRMSSSCYQVNDTFFGAGFLGTSVWNANTPLNEDCLYLNIWTPFATANTTVHSPNKVFRPPEQSNKSVAKRPVLVWIFGGGFYSGTSSLALYEGGVLASEEDIVVVSMNYRVSALGFLYFGRPDAPGNAGLFDQLMALEWIRENIDQFGGDPDRVTIFGESAGAVSVALHLLSPLSRHLFSQAILQSGAATCPWGFMEAREIVSNGLQLASLVNCPSNHSDLEAVVNCLVKADPMALVSQEIGQTRSILNFPFVPVVDGAFILETPVESLKKSNFKPARILLGSNYDEGNSFLIYLPEFSQCPSSSSSPPLSPLPNTNGENAKPPLTIQSEREHREEMMMNGDASQAVVMGELRDPNTNNQPPIEALDLLAGSAAGRQHPAAHQTQAQSPVSPEAADSLAQHNLNSIDSKPCKPNEYLTLKRDDFLKVLREDLNPFAEHPIGKEAIVFEYSNWNNPLDSVSNYDALDKIVGDYYFTCHVNEFANRYAAAGNSVYMYYFKQRSSTSPWPKWMGVLHGDEINFVFGEPLNQMYNYTAKEIELSRRMMKYWANFAKYGNPTKVGENMSMPEKWPEYVDKRQYFELHADFIRIGRGPRAKQCAFWAHYLPNLIDSFDLNQCPANTKFDSRVHPQRRRLPAYGSADTVTQQRNSLLSNVPSPVLVSLSVIFVLTIICLLVYAKRTWKLDLNLSSTSGNSST